MRPSTRGIVLLYAVVVFTVISIIGLTMLDSGDSLVGFSSVDYHLSVAQQAAASGLAYGEATIQAMLYSASLGNEFTGSAGGRNYVPMPAWCGRVPASFAYIPLLGSKDPAGGGVAAAGSPGNQNSFPFKPGDAGSPAFPVFTVAWPVIQNGATVTEQAVFRIELRECALPSAPVPGPNPATLGCADSLYDENLMRISAFWNGASPFKAPANPQAFSFLAPSDFFYMFTIRVEGEAQALDPGSGSFKPMARVVVKEPFTLRNGSPVQVVPQAFWYQDSDRGY